MPPIESPTYPLLGIPLSPMPLSQALDRALEAVSQNQPRIMNFCTVNTLVEAQRSHQLKAALNRGTNFTDGMPLVWLSQSRGFPSAGRVYGPDFMLGLCRRGLPLGLRHFFYGGAPGTARRLALHLKARFPGLRVAGHHCPPLLAPGQLDNRDTLDRINDSRAQVVWIGLGTPKQDLWALNHRDRLKAPILAGVGAAFDFHSGQKSQAPGWMQSRGLEWLFRFIQEPRRLGLRYLVYNPVFLACLALELSGLHSFAPKEVS